MREFPLVVPGGEDEASEFKKEKQDFRTRGLPEGGHWGRFMPCEGPRVPGDGTPRGRISCSVFCPPRVKGVMSNGNKDQSTQNH